MPRPGSRRSPCRAGARAGVYRPGPVPWPQEETYELGNDDLWLAGTAEVALTSLHSGEILDADKLPILYAGYSPCFRREAGSAEARTCAGCCASTSSSRSSSHVLCEADEAVSADWHAKLLALAESLLKALEIPYQVVETSTGDMGLGKFRMNDLESWVPSLGKYRETHSCSSLHDWQARRANPPLPRERWQGALRPHAPQHRAGVPRSSSRRSKTTRPRTGGCGCRKRCAS